MKKHTSRAGPSGNSKLTAGAFVLLFVVGMVYLVSVHPAMAQTGQGAVTGTVTDASNALVPDAQVALTNTATGVARQAQSSNIGAYYLRPLTIGPYKWVVSKRGFE